MNTNINYYTILEVDKNANENEIKSMFRKLSFKYHPDRNKDIDTSHFNLLAEAWSVLSDKDQKSEYDQKSRFGNNYNEYFELFDIKIDFDYNKEKKNFDNFKKNEVLDIYINIDDSFDGNIEYERWVKCKTCDGTGKDFSSKIFIKDVNGKILRTFDADDGCDFCEGSGKSYDGNKCTFCQGAGKIGITNCKRCDGEKRILGKQKISGIKLTGDETKIESMGNCSKDIPGKVGYLLLKKINYSENPVGGGV